MKKQFGKYYLGLDIGTDSVGYAVTDTEYNLIKFNQKKLWGIRLFESANLAVDRRMARATRRRTQRKVTRIKLLQEIFAEEICKIDSGFFMRLNESKFWEDDKTERQKNTIFNDKNYTDIDYHKQYPTIYHLRKKLIYDENPHDIRLVYLALHHIIKNRGHFLFEGQQLESVTCFQDVMDSLNTVLTDEFGCSLEYNGVNEIEKVLLDKGMGKTEKKKRIAQLCNIDKLNKQCNEVIGLMVGLKVKLCDLFMDESLKNTERPTISFSEGDYGDIQEEYAAILSERVEVIGKIKSIYDWVILAEILKDSSYISDAKVEIYNKHMKDLKVLKKLAKKHLSASDRRYMFHADNDNELSYSSYIGYSIIKEKKKTLKKCSQKDFCKHLIEKFSNMECLDEDASYMMQELKKESFLPKQSTKDNGVIPYQVHQEELNKILGNASQYLKFLNQRDEEGYTACEKIISIFTFKIPYYVGPINGTYKDKAGYNCWIERKPEKLERLIRPWNFEEVVDLDKSEEKFIMRMTNKCTYLLGEDVLPKQSILYSKFMVLNEINNIKINNTLISVELKQEIYNHLFLKYKKVTGKKLREYLLTQGYINPQDEIGGFDGDFVSNMSSYIEMKKIVGEDIYKEEIIDSIIKDVVLYGGTSKRLEKRLQAIYGNILNLNQIKGICKLKLSGWGRLSKTFLTEIEDINIETGEFTNIINALYHSNDNLMQLLSKQYGFANAVEEFNKADDTVSELTYNMLDEFYVSPAVKHMIWQALKMVKELTSILGHEPEKVFVEMARDKVNTGRTVSRKNKLIDLYRKCKEEERTWVEEINQRQESDYHRIDSLYLYYTQMGKCMYTGEDIKIEELFDRNTYDIDHIYPQSITKDDSLNNRVLVKREANAAKSDSYPLNRNIQKTHKQRWKYLLEKGFIEKEKYDRLVRTEPLTDNELAGFIARQLVETRQSSKVIATLLGRIYGNSKIVYVKAKNVSDFRQQFDLIKSRTVNDYHHAKDAFLNIVVGNVYDTKFTSDPYKFVKNAEARSYNLKRLFEYKVERKGVIAWEPGDNGTILRIKKIMNNNSILYVRNSFEGQGALFNINAVSKEKCAKNVDAYLPLKGSDKRTHNVARYGGYGSVTIAYFFIVKHTLNKKRIITIESVPNYQKNITRSIDDLVDYCTGQLHLEEPRILVKKLKMQSLLEVDGFPLHVTGKSNDRIIVRSACQLCLNRKYEKYIKRLDGYDGRCTIAKKTIAINEFDKITQHENVELYDLFLQKFEGTIFSKRPNPPTNILKDGRDKFLNLTIEEQVFVLLQTLLLFRCANLSADLRLIGGVKNAGVMTLQKNISKRKSFYIINKSDAAIFEGRVNVLDL